MAAQFVRYTPDVEDDEPNFDRNLQTVIEKTERYIAESVKAGGTGRALRDAHAKGYGLVRGGGDPGLEAPSTPRGIYATPGTHGALIRFSNGSPHAGADATGRRHRTGAEDLLHPRPDPAGGRTGHGTFDYANINGPIFFCNTVEHYLFIQELFLNAPAYFSQGRPGAHRFFTEFVTGKGTLDQDNWVWTSSWPSCACRRPLRRTCCCRATGRWARSGTGTTSPRCASPPIRPSPPRWSGAPSTRPPRRRSSAPAQAELQERPYAFDGHPGTALHRPGAHAGGGHHRGVAQQLSPSVTVARLRLPQQDISGPENLEKMDSLSFTPWRVTAEHARPWATSCGPARRLPTG